MSKWIDFSSDERLVMIQNVAKSLNIDESAVEKDSAETTPHPTNDKAFL